MASSSYWYAKANAASKKAKEYRNRRDKLKTIRKDLDRKSTVKGINSVIDEMQKDVESALKGSQKFTNNANAISDHKLKVVDENTRLLSADNSLAAEINAMDRASQQAEDDAAYYRRKAREAAAAERAAAQQA